MRITALVLASVATITAGCRQPEVSDGAALDYDQMVFLDAETLAEGAIAEAYTALQPRLQKYVPKPAAVTEDVDVNGDRYAVRFGNREFVIYSPAIDTSEGRSWGRAAHAFFTIVNEQLTASPYRFYAVNGGNDLGGMFLTRDQAEAAAKTLPRKADWPYLPTGDHPWYGQPH